MTGPGFPYEGDEDFYASIGKMTISWAYVEFGLDWLVRQIHKPLNGYQHVEAIVPLSLTRKLKYLRRAFKVLPQLAEFQSRFERIANEIGDAAEERHNIIHGFIISQQDDKAIIARMIPGVEIPQLVAVDSPSVLRFAVRADQIQAMAFAAEISKFLEAETHQSAGEMGG